MLYLCDGKKKNDVSQTGAWTDDEYFIGTSFS